MKTALLICLTLLPMLSYAHGGGLDSKGCHTKRATGEYHCHRGAYVPPSDAKHSADLRNDRSCITGPRGGRYRMVNGKKRYGC